MTDPNVPATPPPPAPAPANPYAAAAPAGKPTNVLAIIALIGAFVLAPVGIICGHIALGQIKRTGEGGHALALWGTILGYVFTVLWILIILFSILVPLLILGSTGAIISQIPNY
jgi:hypothetical protein